MNKTLCLLVLSLAAAAGLLLFCLTNVNGQEGQKGDETLQDEFSNMSEDEMNELLSDDDPIIIDDDNSDFHEQEIAKKNEEYQKMAKTKYSKEEIGDIFEVIRVYKGFKDKKDFFIRYISMSEKKEVNALIRFMSKKKFKPERVVFSQLMGLKDADMASIILDGLAKYDKLRVLAFGKMKLGNETCKALGKYMTNVKNLEKIIFVEAGVSGKCLKQMLQNEMMNSKDTISLGKLFKLSFITNPLSKFDGPQILADFLTSKNGQNIRDLVINNCGFEERHSKSIEKIIRESKSLERLDISGNIIEDEGAKSILNALKDNNHLEYFFANGIDITNKSAPSIADVIRTNKKLYRVDIGENILDDEGVTVIAKALGELTSDGKSVSSLQKLDLSGVGAGDVGVQALLDAVNRNEKGVKRVFVMRTQIDNNRIKSSLKLQPRVVTEDSEEELDKTLSELETEELEQNDSIDSDSNISIDEDDNEDVESLQEDIESSQNSKIHDEF